MKKFKYSSLALKKTPVTIAVMVALVSGQVWGDEIGNDTPSEYKLDKNINDNTRIEKESALVLITNNHNIQKDDGSSVQLINNKSKDFTLKNTDTMHVNLINNVNDPNNRENGKLTILNSGQWKIALSQEKLDFHQGEIINSNRIYTDDITNGDININFIGLNNFKNIGTFDIYHNGDSIINLESQYIENNDIFRINNKGDNSLTLKANNIKTSGNFSIGKEVKNNLININSDEVDIGGQVSILNQGSDIINVTTNTLKNNGIININNESDNSITIHANKIENIGRITIGDVETLTKSKVKNSTIFIDTSNLTDVNNTGTVSIANKGKSNFIINNNGNVQNRSPKSITNNGVFVILNLDDSYLNIEADNIDNNGKFTINNEGESIIKLKTNNINNVGQVTIGDSLNNKVTRSEFTIDSDSNININNNGTLSINNKGDNNIVISHDGNTNTIDIVNRSGININNSGGNSITLYNPTNITNIGTFNIGNLGNNILLVKNGKNINNQGTFSVSNIGDNQFDIDAEVITNDNMMKINNHGNNEITVTNAKNIVNNGTIVIGEQQKIGIGNVTKSKIEINNNNTEILNKGIFHTEFTGNNEINITAKNIENYGKFQIFNTGENIFNLSNIAEDIINKEGSSFLIKNIGDSETTLSANQIKNNGQFIIENEGNVRKVNLTATTDILNNGDFRVNNKGNVDDITLTSKTLTNTENNLFNIGNEGKISKLNLSISTDIKNNGNFLINNKGNLEEAIFAANTFTNNGQLNVLNEGDTNISFKTTNFLNNKYIRISNKGVARVNFLKSSSMDITNYGDVLIDNSSDSFTTLKIDNFINTQNITIANQGSSTVDIDATDLTNDGYFYITNRGNSYTTLKVNNLINKKKTDAGGQLTNSFTIANEGDAIFDLEATDLTNEGFFVVGNTGEAKVTLAVNKFSNTGLFNINQDVTDASLMLTATDIANNGQFLINNKGYARVDISATNNISGVNSFHFSNGGNKSLSLKSDNIVINKGTEFIFDGNGNVESVFNSKKAFSFDGVNYMVNKNGTISNHTLSFSTTDSDSYVNLKDSNFVIQNNGLNKVNVDTTKLTLDNTGFFIGYNRNDNRAHSPNEISEVYSDGLNNSYNFNNKNKSDITMNATDNMRFINSTFNVGGTLGNETNDIGNNNKVVFNTPDFYMDNSYISLYNRQYGDSLTISGNYHANGGQFTIDAKLGKDSNTSFVDKISINGNVDAKETTKISLIPPSPSTSKEKRGGVEKIKLIDGISSSGKGNEFKLENKYANGRTVNYFKQGNYFYYLKYEDDANNNDGAGWYLHQGDNNGEGSKKHKGVPVVPEESMYLANMNSNVGMFMHTMHDRIGEPQFTTAYYPTSIESIKRADSMWLRVTGSHLTTDDMLDNFDVRTNSVVTQIGGDFVRWYGGDYRLHLGAMGGYGESRSKVKDDVADSKGKVKGYNVGLYATWFESDKSLEGLYVDVWTQYSWYNNWVTSYDMVEDKYKSHDWTNSIEVGYAFGSYNGSRYQLLIEPQGQIAYRTYRATPKDTNGLEILDSNAEGIETRLGGRLVMHDKQVVNGFQPFFELNWIYNDHKPKINFDNHEFSGGLPTNRYEGKIGVQGDVVKNVQLYGYVGHQLGKDSYNLTHGMLGVKYTF